MDNPKCYLHLVSLRVRADPSSMGEQCKDAPPLLCTLRNAVHVCWEQQCRQAATRLCLICSNLLPSHWLVVESEPPDVKSLPAGALVTFQVRWWMLLFVAADRRAVRSCHFSCQEVALWRQHSELFRGGSIPTCLAACRRLFSAELGEQKWHKSDVDSRGEN